ncbi:MFS transporter [Microbacterium telephonicum]|uniref:Putative MFS family arabinose efflux permease n=1 Tax=Microbacterium telephonicum TaxID=1714841 RepID=A0A498C153_9MICO|nr:MFS transporter [Microbacterium telephonicum]RLK49043.1 putative MFS family arabinose efflux permease [Microbacterium telephonicum]
MDIFSVLCDGAYRKLFTAQVIALLGTGMLTVALGLLAFDLAGENAGAVVGTALTIKMVAYVGLAPILAAAVDRLPRKTVMVGADVVRALTALGLPLVTDVWQIYVLIFLLQAASATFTPTFQSTIPSILTEERDYTRALSLSRLAYDLEAIVSPIAAAALLAIVTYNSLFAATVIGFLGSATLVLVTKVPARAVDGVTVNFWRRATEGIRVFARTRSLRLLMLMNVVVAAGTALVLVDSVVYVKSVFALDDSALAIAYAAFGVGSLLIALNTPRLVAKRGVARTMRGGAAVVLIGLVAALAFTITVDPTGNWWPLLLIWATLGAGTSLVNTPSARLLLAASDEGNRTLVYTAQFSLSHACFLVSYPIAGWVGAWNLSAAVLVLLAGGALAAGAGWRVSRPTRPAEPRG